MMLDITRRYFLLSTSALSVGYMARPTWASGQANTATVRPPEVGQSWRYSKHDKVSGASIDTHIDRVSAVGQAIEIESHSETGKDKPAASPSWGTEWLQKYAAHDKPAGSLAYEVQEPWGMVLIDPHWSLVQAYEKPIPLWPSELRSGWSTIVNTYYKTPESSDALPWQLTMHAHGWESITVPAGHFTALRYTNLIDFRYSNVSGRVAGQRKETIWFAPEIGRWVVRESSGTFYQDVGEEFNENSYRWELLRWT